MEDVLTKQGSRRVVLNEIMMGNEFRNALDEYNCMKYRNGEISVKNLQTKGKIEL